MHHVWAVVAPGATSPEGLQLILDALQELSKRHITVKLGKTEVSVFELCSIPCQDFHKRWEGARLQAPEAVALCNATELRVAQGCLADSARRVMHACMPCIADASSWAVLNSCACCGIGATNLPCYGRELFFCYLEVSSMVTTGGRTPPFLRGQHGRETHHSALECLG